MQLDYLSGMNDVQTRFCSSFVSKALTDSHNMLDVIPDAHVDFIFPLIES